MLSHWCDDICGAIFFFRYHLLTRGLFYCLAPCLIAWSMPCAIELEMYKVEVKRSPFKKRSTVRGEIVFTMPRLTASSASSRGVQALTGTSRVIGFSHARAMICMNCSKVKVPGAPG